MRSFSTVWALALVAGLPAPAPDIPPPRWSSPVIGPVVRRFEPPAAAYGPGHRGVDFAVAAGSPVRAAADGTVAFAGLAAGARSVAIVHPGGLRSAYSFLAGVAVAAGDSVVRGRVLGYSGGTGPGHGPGVVHFSLRRGGRYVDPLPVLERVEAVHLVPVGGRPRPTCPTLAADPGTNREFARPHPTVAPSGAWRAEVEPWEGAPRRGRRDHEAAAGGRSPFRPPDPALEPEDETLHLRRAQRHLHHRSAADAGADREGLPLRA